MTNTHIIHYYNLEKNNDKNHHKKILWFWGLRMYLISPKSCAAIMRPLHHYVINNVLCILECF